MNDARFDALARAASRRGALRALAGGFIAALSLGGRASAAEPDGADAAAFGTGLGFQFMGGAEDPATGAYYYAYYRPGKLEGPGRSCYDVDVAFVAGVAKFRAVCTDDDYTERQSLPTFFGIVTQVYDDGAQGVIGTCRKRPTKYRDRMVMRCNVAVF